MPQKLAIFDIDGTIAVKGAVSQSVLDGLVHMRELGYLTTVSTGRGYARAKLLLGKDFDAVVSPASLMIVEHGTKIVDRSGVVMKADYLTADEIDQVVDFIEANIGIVRLAIFNSPDPAKRIQVWCASEDDVVEETKTRGAFSDVFHSSFEDLRKKLKEEERSNVSAKLKSYIVVENLKLHFTHGELDVIFQDGMMEFIRNISDKATAIAYLENYHETDVANILLAGNAINDVDMLNLSAHTRILVGEGEQSDKVLGFIACPNEIVRVKSPQDLGDFLQKFTDIQNS